MENTIEIGDKVATRFAWRSDETPGDKNYLIGEVLEIEQKSAHSIYYRISGYNGLRPADTVILIEKGDLQGLPSFSHITEAKASAVLSKAHTKGWRGYITASNFNRDEFEVSSGDNVYQVRLRYADSNDEVFASCNCLYSQNSKRLCKHSALVAIDELYSTLEVRAAA